MQENASFLDADGWPILERMARAVRENRAELGRIDGLIGDGDHGANMSKGFTLFIERFGERRPGFTEGLDALGTLLFTEIGGSMGPIYGTLFTAMAEAAQGAARIDAAAFAAMLSAGRDALFDVVDARAGDKTLVDALDPAVQSFCGAAHSGWAAALEHMRAAACAGRDATRDMAARFGRASRLGERSRGVPDAGATSCCLLLCAMADGIDDLAGGGEG